MTGKFHYTAKGISNEPEKVSDTSISLCKSSGAIPIFSKSYFKSPFSIMVSTCKATASLIFMRASSIVFPWLATSNSEHHEEYWFNSFLITTVKMSSLVIVYFKMALLYKNIGAKRGNSFHHIADFFSVNP